MMPKPIVIRLFAIILLPALLAAGTGGAAAPPESAAGRPELAAVTVNVDTGHPLHLLLPGTPAPPSLRLENTGATALTVAIEVTLRDYFGRTLPATGEVALAAGKAVSWRLPATPPASGIWWVDYTLRDRRLKSEKTGRRSFCAMTPAGPTPALAAENGGFLFGMCTHTERWNRHDQKLEVMAAALCGVKVIRTGPEWGAIQPDAQTWDWKGMDLLVELYGQNGITVQPILGFCPQWAAPPEVRNSRNWLDWSRSAPDPAAWRNYVRAVATRYRGRIRTLEVWNEPDIDFFKGSQAQYLEMLKSAHEEVKQTAPEIQIMTGGFATLGYHPTTKKEFHQNVVRLGQDSFDIHATHEHGAFEEYARIVDGPLAEIRRQLATGKPWYPNETAIASMNGETDQAGVLVKKMTFSMARGAIGYNWYDLRNDGFSPTDAEHNYGLLTNDFYPKAGYPAYNNLVRMLRGKTFAGQLNAPGGACVLLFKDGQESVVVAWQDDRKAPETMLLLTRAVIGAQAVDIMGNREPVAVREGLAPWKLAAVPGFFVSPNSPQGNLELTKPLLQVETSPVGCPGATVTLAGALANPFRVAKACTLSVGVPTGMACRESSRTITVPAAGTTPFSFSIAIPPNYPVTPNDGATLRFAMPDGLWRGMIKVPVAIAQGIPAGDPATRPPDFVLNTHAQLVNFSEKDPNLAPLAWTGPRDLSGTVTLGRQPGAMVVRVEVCDDLHFQEQTGNAVWQGDGIQMGVKIPGQRGWWEIGLTRLQDGRPEVVCWTRPRGFENPAAKIRLTTAAAPGKLVYEATLPEDALGLSDAVLENGIRFNLLINDNDGHGRKGWLQIAPGIGQEKNPDRFPVIVFGKIP